MWTWVKELMGLDGQRHGKYYTYKLIDPRFIKPRVFYVGKGTGNRMYQHEKDMRRLLLSRAGVMKLQPKHKRILEIIDDGYEVQYEIFFRSDNEEEVFQVEARTIEHFGLEHLTNETYGYGSIRRRQQRKARRQAS